MVCFSGISMDMEVPVRLAEETILDQEIVNNWNNPFRTGCLCLLQPPVILLLTIIRALIPLVKIFYSGQKQVL